jgi:hypothetical protein
MATSPLVILFLAAGLSYQEPAKASGWMTVTSREGDFHIDFPARPMEQNKTIPSAAGNIEQKLVYVRAGGCLFTVQRFRYPRPFPVLQIYDRLNEQKKGHLQGQTELVRGRDVTVDDVTGQQFETRAPSPRANGTVTSLTRHFIKGSSYYVITVMSAPDRPLPPEADRFFDSFGFTGPEAAKAEATPKAGAMVKGRPDARAPAGVARPMLPDATPEDALRTFMVAAVAHDEAALREITLPDRELVWLLRGQPAPAQAVERMRALAADMKIKRLKPGDRLKLPQGRVAVVTPEQVTEDRALVLPEGAPEPVRLQRVEGHWKVDARPAIDAVKAAAAAQQKARGQ